MIIENATIIRVDPVTGSTPGGDRVYGTGSAIAVRASHQEPTRAEQWAVQGLINDLQAVLFVDLQAFAQAGVAVPAVGSRITVTIDEVLTTDTYEAAKVTPLIHDPVSHWKMFLKKP